MKIKILSGPSREQMFDNLRLYNERRKTPFTIENEGRILKPEVYIQNIGVEDGSGESWIIEFRLPRAYIVAPRLMSASFIKKDAEEMTVKAYYSTRNRKGIILGIK